MRHALFTLFASAILLTGQSYAQTSLPELLSRLPELNPRLQAASQDAKAAKMALRSAQGEWLPTVQGELSWADQQVDIGNVAERADTTPRSVGVTAEYILFNGGERSGNIKQNRAQYRATLAAYEEVYNAQALATAEAYLDVLRDNAVLDVRDRQVKQLETNLQAVELRFEVGDVTRTDVAQARARLATARAERAVAEGDLMTSRAELAALVGEVADPLVWPESCDHHQRDVVDLEVLALRQNATVKRANQEVRAAKAGVQIARAEWWPTVTLSASWARVEGARNNGNITDTETNTVAATVSVPLFNGGQRWFDNREAIAERAAAWAELEAVRRDAVTNVRSAYTALKAAQLSARAFQQGVAANQLAAEGVRAEEELGTRSILDLLDAEQELVDAQASYLSAQRDLFVAEVNLLANTGELLPTYLPVGADKAMLPE